jgi:hypothetical protein
MTEDYRETDWKANLLAAPFPISSALFRQIASSPAGSAHRLKLALHACLHAFKPLA